MNSLILLWVVLRGGGRQCIHTGVPEQSGETQYYTGFGRAAGLPIFRSQCVCGPQRRKEPPADHKDKNLKICNIDRDSNPGLLLSGQVLLPLSYRGRTVADRQPAELEPI